MNNEVLVMSQNSYSSLINNLIQCIEKNDIDSFRNLLTNNLYFINKKLLNMLLFYCTKDDFFRINFLSILINFGIDPNTIIDDQNKYINSDINNIGYFDSGNNDYKSGKSILMVACETSNYSLVKTLCEVSQNKKSLHISEFFLYIYIFNLIFNKFCFL